MGSLTRTSINGRRSEIHGSEFPQRMGAHGRADDTPSLQTESGEVDLGDPEESPHRRPLENYSHTLVNDTRRPTAERPPTDCHAHYARRYPPMPRSKAKPAVTTRPSLPLLGNTSHLQAPRPRRFR